MSDVRPAVALPTNGYKPGMTWMLAGLVGRFHAARAHGRVEAWLGERRRRMTWPAGWTVRLDPPELIDRDGNVFAREGDFISAGGGLDADGAFAIGPLTLATEDELQRLRRAHARSIEGRAPSG